VAGGYQSERTVKQRKALRRRRTMVTSAGLPYGDMFSPYLSVTLAAMLSWLARYLYRRHRSSRHILPFPPGPKPLPLLGNLFDMPTSREYEVYTQWGKKYGDVVHVNALGQHIIILNSMEAANELLDQRSTIYSSRPYIPMVHEPGL
jgi:hypothetical protein